jgi:hypothetical protein
MQFTSIVGKVCSAGHNSIGRRGFHIRQRIDPDLPEHA